MPLESAIGDGSSPRRTVDSYPVCLTDLFRADFGKANMVKFALGDEFGHDACALFEGNTMNDACRLKQVKFFGAAELGEDEIDFAFNGCFSKTQIFSDHMVD